MTIGPAARMGERNLPEGFCRILIGTELRACIWTTIAICEVNDVDDEVQAGKRR
jgi:hypothetical protein